MKFALDTEFLEDGRSVTLISLALVAEDGREYYAEVKDAPLGSANAWVRENVIVHLDGPVSAIKSRDQIRSDILKFVGAATPVFWGYYCAYDWVLLTQLIGDFATYQRDAPTWPKICFDIEQESQLRTWSLKLRDQARHHALDDARWVMQELARTGV